MIQGTQDSRAKRRTAAQQTRIEKTGSNPAKRPKSLAKRPVRGQVRKKKMSGY